MILPVGTPLWKAPAQVVAAAGALAQRNINTVAALPDGASSPSSTHKVLVGITVRDGEDTRLPMNVQESGVGLARVRGEPGHAVAPGDTLVQKTGKDYLVKQSAAPTAPVAGTAEGTVAENTGDGVDAQDALKKVKLIRVRLGQGGGGPGVSASGKQFRFKSLANDYLVANSWDGSSVGADDVKIALPYELRYSPWHNKTVGGILYFHVSVSRRHAIQAITTIVEFQVIVPAYSAANNNLIYALQNPDGGTAVTSAPEWIDLNVDGRAWAQTFKEDALDASDPNL